MVPAWFAALSLFLFGLVFGSFANVVIWRLPRDESLSQPPSHCPHCDTAIKWYDNVPVLSWLVLRARCRSCGAPISARYPFIEATSGLLWLLAWALWGLTPRTAFGIVFFYALLILSAIDLDHRRLPNKLVLPLIVLGAVGVAASSLSPVRALPLLDGGGFLAHPLASAAFGALISSGFTLLLALVWGAVRKQAAFGMGDVKLLFATGLFLGAYAVLVVFLASLIGSVVGVIEGARSRSGLKAMIPFGPSIAAASVVVAAFGPSIWTWYMGLIQ